MPRTVSETWKTVTSAEVKVLAIVVNNANSIDCRADYVILRQGDDAVVKRGSVPVTLTAGQRTTLMSFVTSSIVPAINTAEGTT